MESKAEKLYVSGINSIKSIRGLMDYLKVMASHPYTDFVNAAILMASCTDVGMYHRLFEDDTGTLIEGYVYDHKQNTLIPCEYTYYNTPGPQYNRKMIECNLGLYGVNGHNTVEFDPEFNIITYPGKWSEDKKAEALFGLIYDRFCYDKGEASYYRDCVVYMMMVYAGFSAYLPSATYKDIKRDNQTILDAYCFINIKYQLLFRLAYGSVKTPFEQQLSKGIAAGNKFDNPLTHNYYRALKHLYFLGNTDIIRLPE